MRIPVVIVLLCTLLAAAVAAEKDCKAAKDCLACSNAGSHCGWCASSGMCLRGTRHGPTEHAEGDAATTKAHCDDWWPVGELHLCPRHPECYKKTDCQSCLAHPSCDFCASFSSPGCFSADPSERHLHQMFCQASYVDGCPASTGWILMSFIVMVFLGGLVFGVLCRGKPGEEGGLVSRGKAMMLSGGDDGL